MDTITLKTELPAVLPTEHQELMNVFYNEWREQGDAVRQHQIAALMPSKVNMAVALGNWNYQVHNGGYAQWHDNGYSTAGAAILDYLQRARQAGVEGLDPLIESLEKGMNEIRDYEKRAQDEREYDWYNADSDDEYSEDCIDDDEANRLLWDNNPEPKLQAALDAFDQIESIGKYADAFALAA